MKDETVKVQLVLCLPAHVLSYFFFFFNGVNMAEFFFCTHFRILTVDR